MISIFQVYCGYYLYYTITTYLYFPGIYVQNKSKVMSAIYKYIVCWKQAIAKTLIVSDIIWYETGKDRWDSIKVAVVCKI